MSLRKFTNNATTTLAASITSTATSLSVTGGTGSLFPALTFAGANFTCTLVKNGVPTTFEIINVTARAGDTFSSIARGQEGTTALAWNAGDTVTLMPTAGDMAQFAQFDDLQFQTTNYALDTGTVNNYSVVLSPALTGHASNLLIRWKALNTNTGNCAFNDGVGSLPLTLPSGANVPPGAITAGGIYLTQYDGSKFQLAGYGFPSSLSVIPGAVSQAQVPQNAVTQFAITGATPSTIPFRDASAFLYAATAAVADSTSKLATTAFVNPNFLVSPTGFVQLACGLIIQWGKVQVSNPGGPVIDISVGFPVRFPNGIFAAVASTQRNVATNGQASSGSGFVSNLTVTGMTVSIDSAGTFSTGYWVAIGF